MAGRGSYGDVLKEARERRGFDIASMARKLHIRPDILKAIEEGDFERTPARGYTRNMVRSYANNLGLDASRITEMYLDEVHAFETGRPQSKSDTLNGYNSYIRRRETVRSSRSEGSRSREDEDSLQRRYDTLNRFRSYYPDEDRSSGRSSRAHSAQSPDRPSRSHVSRSAGRNAAARQSGERRNGQRGNTRSTSERRRSDRSDQRSTQHRQARRASERDWRSDDKRRRQESRRKNRQNQKLDPSSSHFGNLYAGSARGAGVRNRIPNGYPSIYSQNSTGGLMEKLPFLGIVAVVAIIVIIILVVLFNGSKQSADNIPDIPISGLTDTSNPEGEINSNITETAPTEAIFKYAVDDGAQSWIEIYENGSDTPSFAGIVDGPKEEEIKVTDKLVILTANPGPVHIAVDGTPLEFKEEDDSAYYRCEVDFKEILDNWKKEHPTISINSNSSAASSSKAS